ncbi:hypothetical protein [Pedobacter psychrodurus]|uniref:hypothetical protein n=1 Tax=Pedobacter psychrodurus TaxID=2530456 RepID=UPI002930D9B3|nr:hypothetical protein [Pedobacter psychrodurus]
MRIATIFLLLLFLGCKNAHEQKQEVNHTARISVDKTKTDTLHSQKLAYQKWKGFKADTLNYLVENFVDRKSYYKNKPLGVLLKDIEIPIVHYTTDFSYPPNEKYINGITLMFERNAVVYNKFQTKKKVANLIVVNLKGSLTNEEVRSFLMRYKRTWSKQAALFFDEQLVEDIAIVEYDKKTVTDLQRH